MPVQDDPFRTRDHVADFDGVVAEIVRESGVARSELPMASDIAYGSGQSERLDLFFPQERGRDMPVHLFVHGGYWRMFSKQDFSCIAQTITRAGAIAVIVDYALMPAARMAAIVDQIRRARNWLLEYITDYGGNPARLTVSGHSAGAHLSTFLFQSGQAVPIQGAFLLGGLYDLKPLQSSFLQPEIGITDEEVTSFTPMDHQYDPRTRVEVLVGANETAPFHQQARDFAAMLEGQGLEVKRHALPGRNHMDSVRDLGRPQTEAARRLAALIERS
jgi:arylformamidase